MPEHEALGEHEPFLLREVDPLLDVGRTPGERLLAEHVLPRLERAHHPFDVQRVRERDVDRVDLGIAEQRVVAPVCPLDPVLPRIRLRPSPIAACDGDHLDAVGDARAREHEAVHACRREHAPADGHSSSFVSALSSSLFVAPVMIATASGIVCVFGVTTATRRPRRMMWIRSASSKTCGMSWLIRITGRPRSRTRRIRSSTWRVSLTPSAAVGSSMITSRRAQVAARATATPWRWPPGRGSTACVVDLVPSLGSGEVRGAPRRLPPLLCTWSARAS